MPGLLVAGWKAPYFPVDAKGLRVRPDLYHESRRLGSETGLDRLGTHDLRLLPRRWQAHRVRLDARSGRGLSTIAGPQQRIRLGVFPGYDIYLATDDGRIRKKLPDAPGYDAEATVNWKTGKVVYTSLASGDLDLWTMNADGSYKKQITRSLGYDGGAAFSRDGSKLVWRANHPGTPEMIARYKELLADNLTAPMKMDVSFRSTTTSISPQLRESEVDGGS